MKKSTKRHFIAIAATAAIFVVLLCGCSDSVPAEKEKASYAETYYSRLESCVKQIEAKTDFRPEVVLVLGTGLGSYADSLDIKMTLPYKDIEDWPQTTAPEHAGNLIFAEYNGVKLAVMQGRLHTYEGYSADEVVLPRNILGYLK